MAYIDSDVFIYPMIYSEESDEKARKANTILVEAYAGRYGDGIRDHSAPLYPGYGLRP